MKTLFVCFAIFFTLSVLGQQRPNSGSRERPFLKGVVVNEDGQPVPFASVAAVNLKDSTRQKGTTTDETGHFQLFLLPSEYDVKISFLSYEPKKIGAIKVNSSGLDLGTITLEPGAISLNEVEVLAEKEEMQLFLDKRVFNINKDLGNVGSNAAEILDNLPSVSVDIEGNVSLRGSENVRILVDGKPSGLVGIGTQDALRQLQGEMIEKVEVITNPSSRYDAEGEAGIINIVLKKEKEPGVNGSFNILLGYPHKYTGAYSLNFRRKWVNLFSSYSVHYRKTPGSGTNYQEDYLQDTTLIYTSERDHERGGLGNTLIIGSDFFINDQNTLTFSSLLRFSKGNNESTINYDDLDDAGSIVNQSIRIDEEVETKKTYEAGLDYYKTFEQEDQELSVSFRWSQSEDHEDSDITESEYTGGDPIYQRTQNTEDEQDWLVQADYIHPLLVDGKIEVGGKGTIRTIENNYLVEELNENGEWEPLPGYNDFFIYDENIFAAYAMLGDKVGQWSWQVGARIEYTNLNARLVNSDTSAKQNYIDLFPSAYLSYEFEKAGSLQLSYTRRLSRPRFRNLLPFSSYSDSRNVRSGNPDLKPEYSNSIELTYMKRFEKGSFLPSIYYRYKTGVVERVSSVDSTGVTRSIPINLSTGKAFGMEFNLNYDIKEWWTITGSVNFYRSVKEGQYDDEILNSEFISATFKLSTKITVIDKLDIQTSFNYNAPRETTQGRIKSIYNWDAGLSMDVLKDNGTLTFSAKDLLNSRKRRYITDTKDIYAESEFQWRSRQFILSFNYRLHQKKKRGGRQNIEGMEDLEF